MNPITRAAIKADVNIPSDRKDAGISFLEERDAIPLKKILVTQAEAGRMLSCSRATIYRLVKTGEIHPVSIRGMMRYSTNDLQKFAAGK